MTSPVIDLVTRPDSPNVHWPLPTTTTTTAAPKQQQQLFTTTSPQHVHHDSIIISAIKNIRRNSNTTIAGLTVEFIESHEIDRKIEESVKEVVISSVKHAMRAPLRARFKDLPTSVYEGKKFVCCSNACWRLNYDKGLLPRVAYEALQDSIVVMK
ncbi:hypothetical protein Tco_0499613 [Tanacetum coccineum]